MGQESEQESPVLIAEDSDALRGMLRQFLERNGYRVLEALDGLPAVAVALGERPNLVLMDLGLPGADGLTAVVELREHVPAAGMPVIMVSAYDRLEYRTETTGAGCSGYVTKPVDPASLLRTIQLLLRQGDVGGGAPV